MRLLIQRYQGLLCFSVRGEISDPLVDILYGAIEDCCKEMLQTKVEPLILNFSLCSLSKPGAATIKSALIQLKTEVNIPITLVGGGPLLQEFPSFESYLDSRPQDQLRQALLHLKLEDEVYALESKLSALETEWSQLVPSNENSAITLANLSSENIRMRLEGEHLVQMRLGLASTSRKKKFTQFSELFTHAYTKIKEWGYPKEVAHESNPEPSGDAASGSSGVESETSKEKGITGETGDGADSEDRASA